MQGQLKLLAALEIKAGLAKKMFDEWTPASRLRSLHILSSSMASPWARRTQFRYGSRLPPAEAKARGIIRDWLEGLRWRDEEVVTLASATPGADISVNEVCANLGVKSVKCLPVLASVVARELFKDHQTWLALSWPSSGAHDNEDTLALGNEPYAGHSPVGIGAEQVTLGSAASGESSRMQAWDADQKIMMAFWDGAHGNAGPRIRPIWHKNHRQQRITLPRNVLQPPGQMSRSMPIRSHWCPSSKLN
jgi:hypothetical protein